MTRAHALELPGILRGFHQGDRRLLMALDTIVKFIVLDTMEINTLEILNVGGLDY